MIREEVVELLRGRCRELLEGAGLVVDLVSISVDHEVPRVALVEVWYQNDDLSFEVLEKISRALGTRDINVGCDLGCASDRFHDRMIHVSDPSPSVFEAIFLAGEGRR